MRLSPNGQQIIANGDDLSIKIWNIDDGKLVLNTLKETTSVNPVFSPNGKQILAGYPLFNYRKRTVRVLNSENGSTVFELPSEDTGSGFF